MQMTNPFPGMNPFLESSWADVHMRLIGYISDTLAEKLPMDLAARAEQVIEIGGDESEDSSRYRADVGVTEDWNADLPQVWQPDDGTAVAVAEPEIITIDRPVERWLEVRNSNGRLITVIEIISPHNKIGRGRDEYLQKQHDYLIAGVNLVEIDLLRSGKRLLDDEVLERLKPKSGTQYLTTVTRARRRDRHELYFSPLRERLAAIRIPLRASDRDVPLDLQPLVDRAYQTGRYWQLSHRELPGPALPADEAEWVRERVAAAGL